MSYSSYMPSSYQEKICVNGVELVNRHELSCTQDRELQRFIDNNSHLLQWKEREQEIKPPIRRTPNHHYTEMRKSLSRGPSPFEGSYNSMDRNSTRSEKKHEEYPPINPNDLPVVPNIDGHNYTNEFPGLEYLSDNTFIEDLIKQGQVAIGTSGLISQPGSRVGSSMGSPYNHTHSNSSIMPRQSHTLPHQQNNSSNYYTQSENTASYHPTYSSSNYGSMSNVGSNYGTLKGGMKHSHATLPPTSPYSSLKRKGVSWLDQERARSLSPGLHQTHTTTTRQIQYNRPASTTHTTTYTTTY